PLLYFMLARVFSPEKWRTEIKKILEMEDFSIFCLFCGISGRIRPRRRTPAPAPGSAAPAFGAAPGRAPVAAGAALAAGAAGDGDRLLLRGRRPVPLP